MIDEFKYKLINFSDENKKEVQFEAYEHWINNNNIGTIILPTGVGKSNIIYMAVIDYMFEGGFYIVCPTINLMNQVYDDLVNMLKLPIEYIGRIGDGFDDKDKYVYVCVINSLLEKNITANTIVFDEIHTYFGKKFNKVLKLNHNRKLGLTATLSLKYRTEKSIISNHMPIVYEMSRMDAIRKNIIVGFDLYSVAIKPPQEFYDKINSLDNIINTNMPKFDFSIQNIIKTINTSNNPTDIEMARATNNAIAERKQLLSSNKYKVDRCIQDIVKHKDDKVILFVENIDMCNAIKTRLDKLGIDSVVFHSKLDKNLQKNNIVKFKLQRKGVIISVRSLDTGVNIPDCNVAMILNSISCSAQTIQKIGRIVRKYNNKEYAIVYNYYIDNTKDKHWATKRKRYLKDGVRISYDID